MFQIAEPITSEELKGLGRSRGGKVKTDNDYKKNHNQIEEISPLTIFKPSSHNKLESVLFKYDSVEAVHNGAALKVPENVRYSLIMSV